jgi:hypothetical protein
MSQNETHMGSNEKSVSGCLMFGFGPVGSQMTGEAYLHLNDTAHVQKVALRYSLTWGIYASMRRRRE